MTPRATPARLAALVGVLAAVLAAGIAAACLVGPLGPGAGWETVRDLRLPRALLAAVVGGCLAAGGCAFQALLRNPLASPYILGVSGGGSLGAALAVLAGIPAAAAGIPLLPAAAFAGCLLAVGAIHALAWRGGRLAARDLLLAGVVANSFFLASLSVVQYLASPHDAARILHWTLGAVRAERVAPGAAAILALAGLALLLRDAAALNLVAAGDETAALLGVEVARVRRRCFVAASLLTAVAVAASGPVGFVGLFVPHAVRRFTGPDHRLLLPASALAGAAFLAVADAAARTLFDPLEVPVGVLTAVVGAPAFVLLLSRGGPGGRSREAGEEGPA